MATLEIHEAGQRVRRVRIGRDHPTMLGTNPLCDVILAGADVQPYHGRISWGKSQFKVEAVADVALVEVNGRRVRSKGLRQGDEILLGRTRVFLLSVEDDGPEHGEKTVIQEPPPARDPSDVAPAAPPPPPPPRVAPGAGIEYHKMEMAAPSLEFEVDDDFAASPPAPAAPPARPGPAPLPRRQFAGPVAAGPARSVFDDPDVLDDLEIVDEAGVPSPPGPRPAARQSWPRRLVAIVRGTDRPPEDERVFTSPVVIGLAATFLILVAASLGLYRFIVATQARQQFAAATASYDRGDFRAAIKGYDAYLAAEPGGNRAGKARVYRALARVRQFTGATSGSWNNAFKEAEAMPGEVGDLPEYRDVSVDLAAEVRAIAEGMFERARDLADPAWLAQGRAAVALHARVAGSAAESFLARSKVGERLAQAEQAIRKAADLKAAIAAVDAAIAAGRPGEAYHARSRVIRRYPDLAGNKDLAGRLGKINDLIRAGVRPDPSGRPGLTEPVAEPLGPPTSLVYRSDPARPAGRSGPVAFALADGWAWGFDAATGAPLWQHPVGLAAPFPPARVEGGATALALMVDARTNELVCREARSGRFVWRQGLDGWATDPPLVLGARVLQPMVDGRLVEIDLRTGDRRGTLALGRRLARGPVVSESADRAYLLAEEDCLFTLGLDPLACTAVDFLGHEAGAIACTPARAGRLLVVAENHALDSGRWRVLILDAAGSHPRQVQEVPVAGWTWGSPVTAGPVIWSASDRGEVVAYAIGRLDAKAPPLAPIARLAPGDKVQGPAFPLARSDREFVVASGLSGRYDLDVDRGKLAPSWTLGAAGRALAPPQVLGRLTVLTQQPEGGRGAALWGLDSLAGEVRWRSTVGAPWPAGWVETASGDALSTLLGDGRDLTLTREQLRAGGFVEQAMPKPGLPDRVTPGAQRLEVAGATVLVPAADADRVLLEAEGDYRPVPLPAHLAARPLAVGKNLLVAGQAGRVYLVEAASGLSVADPLVPPFDRARPTRWLAPAALDGDAFLVADAAGTLRRLVIEAGPRARLAVAAERKLDSPPLGDPAATGPAVVVATADLKLRSFAGRDLAPLGTWPINTAPALGPCAVGGFVFAVDAAGQVFCFDGDGRRLWTAHLRGRGVVGTPVVRNGAAWFATRDEGGVEGLSLVDGATLGQTGLDAAIAAGLLACDTDLVVPTGSSMLQTLVPPAPAAGAPGAPR